VQIHAPIQWMDEGPAERQQQRDMILPSGFVRGLAATRQQQQ